MQAITLILTALAAALGSSPLVPAAIKQGVLDALAAIEAIIGSGVTTDVSTTTVLAALSGVLTALEADSSLPADVLAQIKNLSVLVADALVADKEASQVVDETKLNPIDPV